MSLKACQSYTEEICGRLLWGLCSSHTDPMSKQSYFLHLTEGNTNLILNLIWFDLQKTFVNSDLSYVDLISSRIVNCFWKPLVGSCQWEVLYCNSHISQSLRIIYTAVLSILHFKWILKVLPTLWLLLVLDRAFLKNGPFRSHCLQEMSLPVCMLGTVYWNWHHQGE